MAGQKQWLLTVGNSQHAEPFTTKAKAIADYRLYLKDCKRFGTTPEHGYLSSDKAEFILELGPRGGLVFIEM